MKKLTTCILFLFMLTEFYSCEDSIPRGRPTIVDSNVSVTDNTDTTDTTDENEVTQRPSGAIIIQPDACACQNGEPISIGNCEAICASKQSTNEPNRTFFFDVELTESITLDDNYIDVAGWCSSLPGETANNSCSYEIKDENGATSSLPFDPGAGLQSFELDVGGLDTDQTYRITLVESTSQARSTTIQLRLFSDLIDDTIGGPMALMPVNSYSCLFRDGEFDTDTGQLIVNDVARFHFYFIPETRPEPLGPATVPTVNCYDIETYGDIPINSPLFEESTGAFTVWNKDDPRFFFLSGGDVRRVHELIEQNVELQGLSLSSTPELFFPLSWPNGFDDGDQTPGEDTAVSINVTQDELGFYMTPFIDDDTFRAYCPTREHYYSDSPLFKAMREIVAVDTEGLYAAKQENVCDFLLIKESLLKQIWFYKEGGVHIEPTDDTVQGKQVQFYWPADPNSPFIKKSYQRVYTIKGTDEIACGSNNQPSNDSSSTSGTPTQVPPHDNRIGCIPVISD